MTSLYDEVRDALKRHAISQADFAVRAGIRESYMSQLLREERDIRMSTAQKIRTALDRLEHESRA